ncbi:hypothetical protein SAY87_022288 [Trapa incisa]|uniref:Inosine/uridine-preferring nucleoside hydrolase domain-containing protein n=1 Tax=Trapa incisa TaxID=236973 RepID=A0AAN7K7T5_9MYRT|nr:hypothetical protein SAY87_022288 [Trapa incisa]
MIRQEIKEEMLLVRKKSTAITIATLILLLAAGCFRGGLADSQQSNPRRILMDADVNVDDVLVLLYLLKLNRSEFSLEQLKNCAGHANAWSNASHSVNHIYDILFMMGRDDVAVGVGVGGITGDGTILPDVGGYLPLIEQVPNRFTNSFSFLQSIPGLGGRLSIDSNYAIRKAFLPQGTRRYYPHRQPTAQQVIHSGIAVTLVPLDATNTIPITEEFFNTFEQMQSTHEAQYCFQSLKMVRDTWVGGSFHTNYYMWDSFASGVAVSMMRNGDKWNEFAEMKYMNITVITSDEPYGITDGSNPMFDQLATPKFKLTKDGVHSCHVQTGLRDPFCTSDSNTRKCKAFEQDGSTAVVNGSKAVPVLVVTKAKPNQDSENPLDKQFFASFLNVLNDPQQSARFNLTEQFPYYRQALCTPDLRGRELGKPVVFDMDMSAGDFLTLFYLLKVPIEEIHIKAILVSPTGWANAATIDVIYDLLHMMDRDDIPVGLGRFYATNQTDPVMPITGECKYTKANTTWKRWSVGLGHPLWIGPRPASKPQKVKFTAKTSVKAQSTTENPDLRQPLALEVWDSVVKSLTPGSKITVLTNGPLTNLADIIQPNNNSAISVIQEVYIVGGHISRTNTDEGNVFTIPSNRYAEFNMFLDPLAAKTVLSSNLNVTLVPLTVQRSVSSFTEFLKKKG